MEFYLTVEDYIKYLKKLAKKISDNRAYITAIGTEIGNGDHWSNMNMAMESILEKEEIFRKSNFSEIFERIGRSFTAVIGGASGILYGSAYLEAAKVVEGKNQLDMAELCAVLGQMSHTIMRRGNTTLGEKTMLDAIAPAVEMFQQGLREETDFLMLFPAVKQAAKDGAENTKNMYAIKGRAYYQADRGLHKIDPGAVTMSYQVEVLMDCLLELMQNRNSTVS